MSTDWRRLLSDIEWLLGDPDPRNPELLRTPVGGRELARRLGLPYGSVRYWMDEGGTPNHDLGDALIEAWCRLTGKQRHFRPFRTLPTSAATAKR
jgi:hypothetical protein